MAGVQQSRDVVRSSNPTAPRRGCFQSPTPAGCDVATKVAVFFGQRQDRLPILVDELTAYKARLPDLARTALVFSTSSGRKYDRTKVGPTMLAPAIEKANEALLAAGQEPLPEGLTPHSLRRTFASILLAVGESPVYAMNQLGHVDPTVTRGIYAKVMDRRDGEAERLKALVLGEFWYRKGTETVSSEAEVMPEPCVSLVPDPPRTA
jgi:integrase